MDNHSSDEKPVSCPIGEKQVSRRDFLDLVIKGGLFITLGSMLLPALRYLWPVTHSGPSGGLIDVGPLEEIAVGESKKVVVNGSVFLIVRTADEVKAFSAICTHLGCVVAWDHLKKQIECPCHAGIFDLNGKVVSGPPPRPLPVHQVSVINGKIFLKA